MWFSQMVRLSVLKGNEKAEYMTMCYVLRIGSTKSTPAVDMV